MAARFSAEPALCRSALIETGKGGRAGGGAHLTPLGAKVLDAYRDMEQLTEKAIAPIVSRLNRMRTPDKRGNKGW